MRWRPIRIVVAVAIFGVLTGGYALWRRTPRASGPLSHQVYVWQRAWTPAVREGVRAHGPAFSRVVVLGAEISFRQGNPVVQQVAVDEPSLAATTRPVGVALRVGAYVGPFNSDGEPINTICGVAAKLIAQARAAHRDPAELQIDFDAAESKLVGYTVWLKRLRETVAPVPVTFTALPSWLKRREFPALAQAAGGYVLQVHSFERPATIDAPFEMCYPVAAREAVERAARIGVPFRVALPTYGYLIAFDRAGHFIGLSAEGPNVAWPVDAGLRDVRANAPAMSNLIHQWTIDRPAAMQGVIWYRLPSGDDRLNWRWPTLNAVMQGRLPLANIQAQIRRSDVGLYEVELVNNGNADGGVRLRVEVALPPGLTVASSDAIGGFEKVDSPSSSVTLQATPPLSLRRLGPDEHLPIGWFRLVNPQEHHGPDMEVQAHVVPIQP